AWRVLSAGDCGAWHERERIWIVAHASGRRYELADEAICAGRDASELGSEAFSDVNGLRQLQPQGREQDERGRLADDAQDSLRIRCGQVEQSNRCRAAGERPADSYQSSVGNWPAEPDVVRMVHGVPARVD